MRRSLFIFLIAALTAFGLYRWFQLDHRLHRRTSDGYTPAENSSIDPKDLQVLSALDSEYTRLVQAVVPSVVSITSSRTLAQRPMMIDPFDFLFPNRRRTPQTQTQLGSGVIVSREGHILTNHHVIAGMDDIKVQLVDGRVETALLIGSDAQTDIAVVKIDAHNIEPLRLGDSDEVHVGQLVFAVGNPFGLHATVTQGIVSAKGRRAMADSGVEFLQSDAAVNQGNSGGPLINVRGEIVGINSAIFSTSPEGSWLGISFAIPSNVARRALESLLKSGRVVRGYLGVMMQDVKEQPPQVQEALHLTGKQGILVVGVQPGSPAERAGLQAGDAIIRLDGREVPDKFYFRSRVAELDLHTKVELTILRQGQEKTITAEIVEAPVNAESKPVQNQP